MSVKTEGLSVDSPIIKTIDEEMRDGRVFGQVRPQGWRIGIRDWIPTALVTLAEQFGGNTEALDTFSDEAIGRAFYDVLNGLQAQHGDPPLRVREPHTYAALGEFLRAAASRIDESTDDDNPSVTQFPESPWSLNDHLARYAALQEWAANGVFDIQSGVDEQMVYLGSWHSSTGEPGWSSCCGTDARHKAFLGNVMRYKAFLLDDTFTPEVGMLLRIDDALNRGAYYAIGDVVKVLSVSDEFLYTEWIEGPGVYKSQSLHLSEVRRHHVVVSESENDVPQHDSTVLAVLDEKDATIARLEAENRRLANDLSSAQRHHQEDNTLIGEALIQEANDRDWCDEYDRVIQRLNERLHIDLPIRESDYEVRVSGYLRIPFSYTVSVTANSHDDAEEQVSEDYGSYLPEASTLAQSGYLDRYSAEVTDDDLEFEQV